MKPTTDVLRAIAALKGGREGRVLKQYFEDLLSLNNKKAAYELEQESKYHLSGRIQQIYEILDLFETCIDTLDKRKHK